MKISEYFHNELNSASLSSREEITARFDRVAEYFLNRCLLTFDDRSYHLSEIEFYYYSDIHPDPFVHRHPNQLKTGLWYFHNVGQDLTFGSDGCYGGILIRGIATDGQGNNTFGQENFSDGPGNLFDGHGNLTDVQGNFHDGPGNLFDRQGNLTDVRGNSTDGPGNFTDDQGNLTDGPVKTFDELFNKELSLDEAHSFHVKLSEKTILAESQKIFSFPRVGMYPKGQAYEEEYFFKRYRYLSRPWLTKAERHVIYLWLKYFEGNDELLAKLQIDKSMIRDYEKAFRAGQEIYRVEAESILSGSIKMNVLNKCRLLGWFHETFG